MRGLEALRDKHPCVGDIRGAGLHTVIELVKNRDTRAPLSPFNASPSEPMAKIASYFRQEGLSTFVRWNWIFCCPPLIITEDQIQEGLDLIDSALALADPYVT
jgi:taurine--2-oxoglutarate transaminase